jgi:23S rRNA (pseudouridine1915-N3)-methyltransferase
VRVVVISVGAPKMTGLATAIADYESRVAHYFKFEALEVRQQRIQPSRDANVIVEAESRALLEKVPSGLETVALDERGHPWTSEQLADYLNHLALHALPGVAFLVGGPLGLSEGLRDTVNRVLRLSSLTLPHELARLLLAEQLYRAGTILRGEPYHKNA